MALDRRGEPALGLRPRIRRARQRVGGHRAATAVAGSGSVTSEPVLPPSFVQRSASLSPGIRRNAGASSDTHGVPQRQQLSCCRAIGARQ